MTDTLAGLARPSHAGLEDYLQRLPTPRRLTLSQAPAVLVPLPTERETLLPIECVVAEKYVRQVDQGKGPKDAYPVYLPLRMGGSLAGSNRSLAEWFVTAGELAYDEMRAQSSPRDRSWGRYCAAYLFDAHAPDRKVKIRLDLSLDPFSPASCEFELTGREWLRSLAPSMMPFAAFIANSTAIVDPVLLDSPDNVRNRRSVLLAHGLDASLVDSMKCPPLHRNHPVTYSLVMGFAEATEGEKEALFEEVREASSFDDIRPTLGSRIVSGSEQAHDPDVMRDDSPVSEGLLVLIAAGLAEMDFESGRIDLSDRGKLLQGFVSRNPGFETFRMKELGTVIRRASVANLDADEDYFRWAERWIMTFFGGMKNEMNALSASL